MRIKSLQVKYAFMSALFVLATFALQAQPANDNCSGAIDLPVADSETNAVLIDGDTRNTVDEASAGIPVCSGNFYRDAVWYKFTAPATPYPNGFSIKIYYGDQPDDFASPGVALYASCDGDPANQPLFCANAPAGDRIFFGEICPELTPGATYYVRVWSNDGPAADWQAGWGTFRIAAFENDPPAEVYNVLWDEGQFDGGLNGWTTEGILCSNDGDGNPVDASNALWQWAIDGLTTGNLWGGQRILSRTACNGAVVFDSDFLDNGGVANNFGYGPCPANQEGSITSPPIDLSGFNVAGVSLLFHQRTTQFQSTYFVEYSLDNGNSWISIEINQDVEPFTTATPPGVNPTFDGQTRVPLPGAAGSTNLLVRFRIEANYYYWIIDDVQIVETECNNMRANDFFAIAPNATWHMEQLHDFGALIDVENVGACAQTGVAVDYEVADENGNVVISGTLDYGTIGSDSIAENIPFAECFDLPAGASGMYTGTYTVRSDSTDFDDSNNSQSFRFMISNTQMAKEIPGGVYSGLRPVATSGSLDYAFGNYYYLPKGGDYEVCDIEVGISNADDLSPSVLGAQASIIIYLYEWTDLNGDGDCQTADETLLVGFNQYDFQDGDPANTVFTIPMFDENFEPCVKLKNDGEYLLVMQYQEPTGLSTEAPLFMLMSSDFNYAATRFLTLPEDAGGLGQCTHAYAEFLNAGLADDVLGNGAFAGGEVPVLRLNLQKIVSIEDEPLADDNKITILPNPVGDVLTVNMDFVQTMDQVNIRVSDITGKTIMSETMSGVQQTNWTRGVSHLANGSYLLYITTPQGVRTDKFIVQH